ncbi:MAG: hypothetical protein V1886_01285 [archaeon]
MKRGLFLVIFFALLLIVNVSAASASVVMKTDAINDIVIKEVQEPAEFQVTLKNTANAVDYVEFYTFVDAILSPKGAIKLEAGEEKQIVLEVYPSLKLRYERTGSYTFVYYLKSQQQKPIESRLVIRILPLKDMISVSMPSVLTLDTKELVVNLENKENIAFDELGLKIRAAFLEAEKIVSLNGLERKEIAFEIDSKKLGSIMAGKYLAVVSVSSKGADFSIENDVDLREKSNIATTEKETGNLFYRVLAITKENQGNVVTDASIIIKRNIFSNTFTVLSVKPGSTERSAAFYTYKWDASLKPGESFSVEIRTNYLLPLGILAGIAIIAVMLYIYFSSPLIIKKKVRRVKSKTGEFALKIMVQIRAGKDISKVVIRDRIPHLTELYERFGAVKPSRIDKAKRLIEWELPELKRGEEHILSYVLISKVAILGGYNIPNAYASFEAEGKSKHASSNRVIFLAEEEIPL